LIFAQHLYNSCSPTSTSKNRKFCSSCIHIASILKDRQK